MKSRWQVVSLIILIAMLAACSDKGASAKTAVEKEHFLTEKMQTIKKAEAVGQVLQDAASQQRRSIEDQGG